MQRLRRVSLATTKNALVEVVYAALNELNELEHIDVDRVVDQWLIDQAAPAAVSAVLAKHGLDESAIEAEAFRRTSRDLIAIDQLLTSHASRRDSDRTAETVRHTLLVLKVLDRYESRAAARRARAIVDAIHACALSEEQPKVVGIGPSSPNEANFA
jgi:hypothetical protein